MLCYRRRRWPNIQNNIGSTSFVLTGLAVARIMGVPSSNLRIVECLSLWLCSNSAALQFTKRRNVILSGDSPHEPPLSVSQSIRSFTLLVTGVGAE